MGGAAISSLSCARSAQLLTFIYVIFSGAKKGCNDNLKAIRFFVFDQWQMGTWLFALDKPSSSRLQRLPTWWASPTRLWYSGLMGMRYKGNKRNPLVLAIYKEMILFGRTCTSGLGLRIAQYRLYHGARTQKVFYLAQVTGKVGKKWSTTLQ